MKRMLIIGSIAALATVGLAGTANAAEGPNTNACFGQVHSKVVNAGALSGLGIYNVGDLVEAAPGLTGVTPGGQAKKALATSICK